MRFRAVALIVVGVEGRDSAPSPELSLCREEEPFRVCLDSVDVYGSISFFCLDLGRISSKSTGTPRETRNSLLIRERTQFGGCRGGGATSCDHKERERSVRKVEFASGRDSGGSGGGSVVDGKRAAQCGTIASVIDSRESNDEKSRTGFSGVSQSKS